MKKCVKTLILAYFPRFLILKPTKAAAQSRYSPQWIAPEALQHIVAHSSIQRTRRSHASRSSTPRKPYSSTPGVTWAQR